MTRKGFPTTVLMSKEVDQLELLKEFAEFWKIPYSTKPGGHEDETLVSTEPVVEENGGAPVILSPSSPTGFRKVAEHFGLSVRPLMASLRPEFAPGISTFLQTTLYEYSGSMLEPLITDGKNTILSKVSGTKTNLLSVDITSEYRRLLYDGLEDRPSLKFRLVTKLPFSYSLIPSYIRNRSFRFSLGTNVSLEEHLGPVECLRTIFLASLVVAGECSLPRIGFWRRGISHVLTVTHDVETRKGLEVGAEKLAKVEHEQGILSTWNIPSDRYPLSNTDFANAHARGEIGGHDTKHDGRLILLGLMGKVKRLADCKSRLTELSGREVRGFRSPLLQHARELTLALREAGFQFDSSFPSWEPLSPTSFHAHGVGTVFPFILDGVVEIPVSLPQDHQLIRVSGLTPSEAAARIVSLSRWLSRLEAVCVLLVHPDYEFANPEYLDEYRQLLANLSRDQSCEVMTLGALADWWRFRSRAELRVEADGKVGLWGASEGQLNQLSLQEVTSYTSHGFSFKPLAAENVTIRGLAGGD